MKKLCGYDVNGWRDMAVRNWLVKPREEVVFGSGFRVQGALLPSVVQVGDSESVQWVGGAQADVAPHGLGKGWGDIGRLDRRLAVRECLRNDAGGYESLTAAVSALSSGAQFGVMAMDDLPSSTELFQERLLTVLYQANVSLRLLVWRPVLATLFAIEHGWVKNGQSVGVVCHSGDGFSLQRLLIRSEPGSDVEVLAPERRHSGISVESVLGYEGLTRIARNVLIGPEVSADNQHLEMARTIGRLAFGESVKPEVLRCFNGDWDVLMPQGVIDLPLCDVAEDSLKNINECDVVLFETLATGMVRQSLHKMINEQLHRPSRLLPVDSVAEAALIAAQRASRSEPVYFDFLPQISTIIQGSEGTANFDLIEEGETLPAGQLYRSREAAQFLIQSGQVSFSVYLKKENSRWPRKAVTQLGAALKEVAPVDLRIEQSPAAGRAKLYLHSSKLSRQFVVDWDTAKEVEEDWEDLIERLDDKPTVPNKVVLGCDLSLWSGGFSGLLEENVGLDYPDWKDLSDQLSKRLNRPVNEAAGLGRSDQLLKKSNGAYCIASNGKIPDAVSDQVLQHFDQITERAVCEVRKRAAGVPNIDGQPLRFLTWYFYRCPIEVIGLLLDALRAKVTATKHPFTDDGRNLVVVYQGIGRVAYTEEAQRTVIDLIMRQPSRKEWKTRHETACLAFLLSRSDTAPKLLNRKDVELIAEKVKQEFKEQRAKYSNNFSYTLYLLVGLLRWRLKEPRSLVVGRDSVANELAESVKGAIVDLEGGIGTTKSKRYLKILYGVLSELEGRGTNSDLLLAIDAVASKD